MATHQQHQTRIGLARCEHCGRQFNPHSAARHIPWCAKQQKDNRRPSRLTADKREALERYRWRINYRPSNQLSQTPLAKRPNKPTAKLFNRNPFKSSSLNSSASASSSNSTRTSIASVGESQQQQQSHRVAGQHWPRSRATLPAATLKRSVSSLTLVKHKAMKTPEDEEDADADSRQQQTSKSANHKTNHKSIGSRHLGCATSALISERTRTKSASDLSNMSEVVEILAKRMDQIYLQNQRLLDNFAAEQAAESNSDDFRWSKCHHCKSSLAAHANYCHNCGCKVIRAFARAPDAGSRSHSSSPVSSTPEPVTN